MQTKIQHVTDIQKFESIKHITFIALGVLISYYLARGYLILIKRKSDSFFDLYAKELHTIGNRFSLP